MKANEIQDLFNSFESIAIDYDGVECWSARELYSLLGYAKWDRFKDVLVRAKESCENAGEQILDHFADAGKMVKVYSLIHCLRKIYILRLANMVSIWRNS